MKKSKDSNFILISSYLHARETLFITDSLRYRMIEAQTLSDAMKVLEECGYESIESDNLTDVENMLSRARHQMLDTVSEIPEAREIMDFLSVKYDYHNAKTALKAMEMGLDFDDYDTTHTFIRTGRYELKTLQDGILEGDYSFASPILAEAIEDAKNDIKQNHDGQRCDTILDRAYYKEMLSLAENDPFLLGSIRLLIDITNLRTCVRAERIEFEGNFFADTLIDGGNVSVDSLLNAKGTSLPELFANGPLDKAVKLAPEVAKEGGTFIDFERECDNAMIEYFARAKSIPFGKEVITGYIYGCEAEWTAIRTIMLGRHAGLDTETIKRRLRVAYY